MKKGSTRKGGAGKAAKKAGAVLEEAAQQAKVPKEVVERRKRLMKEAEVALGHVNSYPVLRGRKEVEAAKRQIMESYSKGDEVVRQFILFIIHEHLSKAANMRMVENFEFFRKMMGEKAEPLEVRKNVYRAMFNYSGSLEGTAELLFLLGQIG
ncbi:MAG TPA: hypothetical protein PKJ97_01130, partial [Candidatus Bilamarchaeaceae archaeon]|nr:hypothetical protein [Candidatus Bilamarchaeaceae archaeon]